MTRRLALALSIVFLFVAARQRVVTPPQTLHGDAPLDAYTYSDPTKVVVDHVSLDLTVDFDQRRLSGSATLAIANLAGTNALVLDTQGLTISAVTVDGAPAHWTLGATSDVRGAPLTIDIAPMSSRVRIDYITGPNATGLLWNTAEQSFGRVAPYLYTQNESLGARSWIPIEDSPAVRVTYDAVIHAPRGMLALMSATNPTQVNDTGVYRFAMDEAIPPYLIALAVGRLEFRALDARSGIYAEPELLEAAAQELDWIPRMIDAGEQVNGRFPFGRHDILLMPPTYPFGGMEHPRINFINPLTAVTFNGTDQNPRAMVLIAHELSHSWSGDATTLAEWNDVWLNEGFATYLSYRVLEAIAGGDRASYAFYSDRAGYANLANTNPSDPFTILHRDYAPPRDPDELFNSTEYTKGELFLKTLEDNAGREAFDAFLRSYFSRFAFHWIDDRAFLGWLDAQLPGLSTRITASDWIYKPGLPANVSAPTTSALYDRVNAQAQVFRGGRPASQLVTTGWLDADFDLFLQLASTSARSRMAELDAAFRFSDRPTPPRTWLTLIGQAGYQPGFDAVERVLMRGGSSSVVSLYQTLALTPAGKSRAIAIFNAARGRYADDVAAQIAHMLGLTAAASPAAA
jgi:leukotriene-A4 hydrolase